ncbi:MAG: DUF192 domain-containing protein [Patescibacteria group bacterium]|jgi:uncharacterized membrane protein (UPF0127 family)|nr:DUF192 domain-containing protein [bacterium]HQC50133.1 DUF192 domain-containing protein [bacterium]
MSCPLCQKKKISVIIVGVLLGIAIFSLAYFMNYDLFNRQSKVSDDLGATNDHNLKSNEALMKIADQVFKIEIVSDSMDMYRGLSNREELCAQCGMLFVFPDLSERTFVMRDMNFPLDIIFLAEGKIVKIHTNLPPEGSNTKNLYSSEGPADRALEINAGLAAELGLKEGDKLILPR